MGAPPIFLHKKWGQNGQLLALTLNHPNTLAGGKTALLRWPDRLRYGRRMEDFEMQPQKALPKK